MRRLFGIPRSIGSKNLSCSKLCLQACHSARVRTAAFSADKRTGPGASSQIRMTQDFAETQESVVALSVQDTNRKARSVAVRLRDILFLSDGFRQSPSYQQARVFTIKSCDHLIAFDGDSETAGAGWSAFSQWYWPKPTYLPSASPIDRRTPTHLAVLSTRSKAGSKASPLNTFHPLLLLPISNPINRQPALIPSFKTPTHWPQITLRTNEPFHLSSTFHTRRLVR
jgi:hypothetical protein